ncbi:MAG: hypothetical protein ACI9OD_000930 [Limisphaerales bacterium]|jgi:hypothetical protein
MPKPPSSEIEQMLDNYRMRRRAEAGPFGLSAVVQEHLRDEVAKTFGSAPAAEPSSEQKFAGSLGWQQVVKEWSRVWVPKLAFGFACLAVLVIAGFTFFEKPPAQVAKSATDFLNVSEPSVLPILSGAGAAGGKPFEAEAATAEKAESRAAALSKATGGASLTLELEKSGTLAPAASSARVADQALITEAGAKPSTLKVDREISDLASNPKPEMVISRGMPSARDPSVVPAADLRPVSAGEGVRSKPAPKKFYPPSIARIVAPPSLARPSAPALPRKIVPAVRPVAKSAPIATSAASGRVMVDYDATREGQKMFLPPTRSSPAALRTAAKSAPTESRGRGLNLQPVSAFKSRQVFARSGSGAGFRRNPNSPPPSGILSSFEFHVQNGRVTVRDADGSIYNGNVIDRSDVTGSAAASTEQRLIGEALDRQLVPANGFSFRAIGVSRTTKKRVILDGVYALGTDREANAAGSISINGEVTLDSGERRKIHAVLRR